MEHYDRIRIVVVGDSGVGKTSLVHMLCYNEALRYPTWTIGCNVDVKFYTHPRARKSYLVEFIDVGGTSKHKSSRNMFYHQINGIILVHDVSNRKSYYNLWKWVVEILNSEAYKDTEKSNNNNIKKNDFDCDVKIGERYASVPILVVGTKADLVKQELTGRQRRYSIVDEYGGDCVNLCTLAQTHFEQNSIVSEKLDLFFDKVVDKKFGPFSPSSDSFIQSPTFGGFSPSLPNEPSSKKQSWNGFR
ncbi:6953_t:CDS:2 [Entrophospora sp. SA101]|nr:9338_t:CDS:2 [Entrophospora sp. SA101]CAJ0625884.1 9345_t:CDS:2 [Entrophospora sp. SA101]CAJ0745522.1 19344_t:CDS:2 [Entrophospora sp. SA101]CAJ0761975.1 6953_t:CDS:2 [Entrophospora sp. SA101]CAJ0823194.1 12996_t:CDS:2 [Entrophospora sp. SA101]